MYQQPSMSMAPTLQSGDPEYQRQAMEGYEQRTAPNYREAIQKLRQGYASRGLGDSGISALGELGLNQSHLQDVNEFGRQTALIGADKAEENRRRTQERGWQVEDRDLRAQQLQRMIDEQNQRADAASGRQLLGGTLGAIGRLGGAYLAGGPVGGAAAAADTLGGLVGGGY